MSRWLGLIADPTAGGSTYDVLTDAEGEGAKPLDIPVPAIFVPATTAQVDAGLTPINRDDEVRGRRGNTAPVSFASAPKLSIGCRAYPVLLRQLVRSMLGGEIDAKGGPSPKAYEDVVGPIEEGSLPALIAWLRREDQLDRATGLIVSELALTFDIEKEGSFVATLDGLYHQAAAFASAEEPGGAKKAAKEVKDAEVTYASEVETFMLRDAVAFRGAEETEIDDLAGFSLTFNNGMIEDMKSKFRPNHNIERTTIDEVLHKMWYPNQHKVGPQAVTGSFDLSAVDPDAEARRLLTHADKLVFEVAAGPLGTTPAADEMMKFAIYSSASTGGGADPLVRQGDQLSSFDYTGYIDNENEDIDATFVGAAALK
jgi:hypothetical protein